MRSSHPFIALLLFAAPLGLHAQAESCINTVAGGAESSDSTQFRAPAFTAALPDGTLYVTSENAIYAAQVDGTTVVVAGSPATAGFADGASATALFESPQALVYVPALGSLLVADTMGRRVRLFNLTSGMVSTLMGTGVANSTGDGGPPSAASLMNPKYIAVSPTSGDVFVGDVGDKCVRHAAYGGAASISRVGGTMTTVAGACGNSGNISAVNGTLAAAGDPLFGMHSGVAVDLEGTLYVSDSAGPWRVNLATGVRVLLLRYVNLDTGWANVVTSLTVREDPAGAMTPPGRLLLLSTSNSGFTQVLAVGPLPASAGTLRVFHNAPNTRSFTGDGLPALNATTDPIASVTFDPFSRNVFIVAYTSVAVRAVRPDGIINTVLRGTQATAAVSGDGQLAIASSLNGPRGIVIAPNGDIFFAEASAAKVRVLRANGLLGTVAGSGTVGYSGDGGLATNAALNFPYGLALFPNGDLVIAQSSSGCLRLVSATTGIISTLYGKCGNLTSAGDGGPASAATFASAHSVVIDAAGGLYICEAAARVIRYVNATGIINRFAGSGRKFEPNQWTWDPSQEGGPALAVDLLQPIVMALSPQKTHLYFTDFLLETVYAVDIASGILNRVLGLPHDSTRVPSQVPVSPNKPSASNYFSVRGDGLIHNFSLSGPAVNTSFAGYSGWSNKVTATLLGLAFTRSGLLLVSSSYDNFLLSLNLSSGLAEVIAGTGRNLRAGDGGSPLEASLFYAPLSRGGRLGQHILHRVGLLHGARDLKGQHAQLPGGLCVPVRLAASALQLSRVLLPARQRRCAARVARLPVDGGCGAGRRRRVRRAGALPRGLLLQRRRARALPRGQLRDEGGAGGAVVVRAVRGGLVRGGSGRRRARARAAALPACAPGLRLGARRGLPGALPRLHLPRRGARGLRALPKRHLCAPGRGGVPAL
jgi:WD40 repeat protein